MALDCGFRRNDGEGVIDMAATLTASQAWRPRSVQLRRSRLLRFMRRLGLATVDELRERAAADPAWFWAAVVHDLDLSWFRQPDRVLDLADGLPFARWFPGGRFNYVSNAVDRHAHGPAADRPALVWEGEEGTTRTLTYRQLLVEVSRAAGALRALGIRRGDRVGIFLPMTLECAIATLACSRIGAIYTPIFSGYAAPAVAARLNDCGARVLITADGFFRRGRMVPLKEVADAAAQAAPSIERLLVVRRAGRTDVPEPHDPIPAGAADGAAPARPPPWQPARDVWWHDLVGQQPDMLPAVETAADEPYMVIYTSGTTGRPKGAVHVHAGFPIKAAQDMAHCFDIQADDRVWWYTDLGWMMGPWLIAGSLLLGATACLYDGAPDWPAPDRLWATAARQRITTLGLAPTGVRALMRADPEGPTRHDLSGLRALAASGEPWNPESWWWYFRQVGGGRCPLINYSGGTEISGGIVAATTVEPQQPCAFAGPVPGMAADVVDEAGQPVRGRVGELVLRAPWVGMTQGFWQDRERYLETYWSRWPDVWAHGDWALIEDDGSWYIHGRSDDTLNVAGKRVGPAEIESAAVVHPSVAEAAAIGVPDEIKGERVIVFAVPPPGPAPTAGTTVAADYQDSTTARSAGIGSGSPGASVADTVAAQLGKPLRPTAVHFVAELPRTRSNKIMRRVIRAAYLAEDPGDLSSLENPSALEAIRDTRGAGR